MSKRKVNEEDKVSQKRTKREERADKEIRGPRER